jgi:hypothetical protein
VLAKALLPMAASADQQTQADDAVEDQHHGGKHRVSRQRAGAGSAGQHQRDDQRHFDHGHRQRQNQRAEGFSHAVRHYFGMVHGRQHAGEQADGHEQRVPAAGAQQAAGQDQPARDRGSEGPGRDEAHLFHGRWFPAVRGDGPGRCGGGQRIASSLHCNQRPAWWPSRRAFLRVLGPNGCFPSVFWTWRAMKSGPAGWGGFRGRGVPPAPWPAAGAAGGPGPRPRFRPASGG